MPAELTNAERETALTMTADDRSTWHIGSDDPVMIRRFENIGATFVRAVGEWREYTLPANRIGLRNERKPMPEERKAELATRLRAARGNLEIMGAETLKLASYDDEGDNE